MTPHNRADILLVQGGDPLGSRSPLDSVRGPQGVNPLLAQGGDPQGVDPLLAQVGDPEAEDIILAQ